MAKFSGLIGYGTSSETTKGVWADAIIERRYVGDVLQYSSSNNRGNDINNDINIRNTISIVADAYAFENFLNIKYITWMGVKWVVSDIKVERPRLILTIGGVYNV